ncbi:hypothetical protein [Streptomyces sp. TP-A0874]|uniref:hypothetical protein n=1 Tax=Streptomyces sp. TP-A0874 TaxID=549819 RepID=UPI000852C0E5|nr:hypothetical protein [Streptomyces sp. TP-A0874]
MPRLAAFSIALCALAVVAAAVSFARGNLLGILWLMVAGLSSNMAWYYLRRTKAERAAAHAEPSGDA